MMVAKDEGIIFLTGGGLAHHPQKGYASLAIGKSGIWSIVHKLNQELSAFNIHVCTVTVSVMVNDEHASNIGQIVLKDACWRPKKIEHIY